MSINKSSLAASIIVFCLIVVIAAPPSALAVPVSVFVRPPVESAAPPPIDPVLDLEEFCVSKLADGRCTVPLLVSSIASMADTEEWREEKKSLIFVLQLVFLILLQM